MENLLCCHVIQEWKVNLVEIYKHILRNTLNCLNSFHRQILELFVQMVTHSKCNEYLNHTVFLWINPK